MPTRPPAARQHPAAAPFAPDSERGGRDTRATVLLHIKHKGEATVASIAQALGCSLNAVRHHIKELEAGGLVAHDRTRHGVGAPVHTYRLTAAGQTQFPERYASIVASLLEHVAGVQGRAASVALLQAHYAQLGARLCAQAGDVEPGARGAFIARAMDVEGFMATWHPASGGGVLAEHNCPHRVVAERFPELCVAEETFLAQAFGATVTRQSRITAGCGSCSYQVTFDAPAPEDGA